MKKKIIMTITGVLICSCLCLVGQYNKQQSESELKADDEVKTQKKQVIVGKVFKNGYLKKHGNHYHYIKGKPPEDAIYEQSDESLETDDYQFDPKDVIESNEYGYVVRHGNHYHFIPKKNNIQSEISRSIASSSENTTLSQLEKKITELMKRHGLRRDQIIINNNEGTLIYPHGNHYHYEKIGELLTDEANHHLHNEEPHTSNNKQEDTQLQDSKKHILNEQVEQRIKEIMQKTGLTRDKIKVDIENNAIIYPHGNHYHYEKIDFNKPLTNYNRHGIKEEHDDGLASSETHKIVGPLLLNRSQLLNKEAILKAYPDLSIKNIAHYHIVGFQAVANSRVKVGDLKLNGRLNDGIVYLVLKNTPWKEVTQTVKFPETEAKEGYYFKGWSHSLPNEDVVDRSRIFGAQFRLEKFKNSPVVLGPSATKEIKGSDTIDIHDYVSVSFHTLSKGQFIIDGKRVNHAFYYIKQGTTWNEAFANGFELPQTIADESYEFSSFSQDLTKKLDEKVSSEYIWATFGINVPVLAVYTPSDMNNPLSETDSKRPHPKDTTMPYDSEKYVTLAFKTNENGYLSTFFEEGTILTYVVRKGIKWRDLQQDLPQIIAKKGYRIKESLPSDNEVVTTSRLYTIEFEKVIEATP